MKTIKQGIIGTSILLLISVLPCFGVVDQALEVQGTNLVLSWPSRGYEYYMIQYRPSLGPDTPWVQLTNCYRANSTNRTTFIVARWAVEAVAPQCEPQPAVKIYPRPSHPKTLTLPWPWRSHLKKRILGQQKKPWLRG